MKRRFIIAVIIISIVNTVIICGIYHYLDSVSFSSIDTLSFTNQTDTNHQNNTEFEMRANFSFINDSCPCQCHIKPYDNIGQIINCNPNHPTQSINKHIAILSMYIKNKGQISRLGMELDRERILKNHLSYTILNGYKYIHITSINFSKPIDTSTLQSSVRKAVRSQLWISKKLQILLAKLQAVQKVLVDHKNLKYLLWIDFDALFWNCSTKIETQIISKAKSLYNRDDGDDIILGFSAMSIINSGVVLYKNSEWTLGLIQGMITMSNQFASIINVHDHGLIRIYLYQFNGI